MGIVIIAQIHALNVMDLALSNASLAQPTISFIRASAMKKPALSTPITMPKNKNAMIVLISATCVTKMAASSVNKDITSMMASVCLLALLERILLQTSAFPAMKIYPSLASNVQKLPARSA